MAGRAQLEPNEEPEGSPPDAAPTRDQIRIAAARLYGQGYKRAEIARILINHLSPRREFEDGVKIPQEQRLASARSKLRSWEYSESFRDLLYQHAVVKLDMQTPAILGGLAKKAKRGRVDAAKLVLELTGRHNPKGDVQPTQVAVVFNGVPRPGNVQAVEAIPGEVLEVDADGNTVQAVEAETE